MKLIRYLFLFLILVLVLPGCTLPGATIQPTQDRQFPSPTIVQSISTWSRRPCQLLTRTNTAFAPTFTLIPSATITLTPTRMDTLEPAKVDEMITTILRDPGDCLAPCFWGIVPGKTTYDEANNFFYHLGIFPYNSTIDGKDFADYEYQLNNDLSIGVTLTIQNNVWRIKE